MEEEVNVKSMDGKKKGGTFPGVTTTQLTPTSPSLVVFL